MSDITTLSEGWTTTALALEDARESLLRRLVMGVQTWDEYLAVAGEIRGIERALDAPLKPYKPHHQPQTRSRNP
jgi:hypothetical protein